MSDWRPIETAPRWLYRVVPLLLFQPSDSPDISDLIYVGYWAWDGDGYEFSNGEWETHHRFLNDFRPTHWMPLPDPPGGVPTREDALSGIDPALHDEIDRYVETGLPTKVISHALDKVPGVRHAAIRLNFLKDQAEERQIVMEAWKGD